MVITPLARSFFRGTIGLNTRKSRLSDTGTWGASLHRRSSPPCRFLSSNHATQAPLPSSVEKSQAVPSSSSQSSSSEAKKKTYSPQIEEIVKNISQLTLLEAADLVEALKSRLDIADIAMPIPTMVSLTANTSDAESKTEGKAEKSEPAKPAEKTTFTLTLMQIDATQKAKVIKEVKTIMPNVNLVEAKKFVESLPKVLKENGTKEEVEKLKKSLESVGATVKLE